MRQETSLERFKRRIKTKRYRVWLGKRILVCLVASATVTALVAIPVACANGEEQLPAQPTATQTANFQAPAVTTASPAPTSTPTPEANVVSAYDVPLDLELQLFIIQLCEEYHIEPSILFAMAERESRFTADAVGDGGDSLGMFQVQPKWHQDRMDRLGVTDLFDPYQAAVVAVDFLAELLARYDGDIGKALTAYNQGSFKGTVTKYAQGVLARSEEMVVLEVEY